MKIAPRHFVGIPTMLFMFLLIGWIYYIFIIHICVKFFPFIPFCSVFYGIIFHVFLIFMLAAYVKVVIVNPGKVPAEFSAENEQVQHLQGEGGGENSQQQQQQQRGGRRVGRRRFCDRCQVFKPDRCHHCSVCDKCVLKMDHHCPWVNNCVGFYNYKYFMQFLLYTMFLSFFTAVFSIHYVSVKPPDVAPGSPLSTSSLFEISVIVLTAVIFVFLFFFGFHHSRLVSRNIYDLGKRRNWEAVFGNNIYNWWNPFVGITIEGDGTRFASTQQMEDIDNDDDDEPV